MSKLQKAKKVIFIDYVPAELHENKIWAIVYYVLNPFTETLERKRNRVKPLKSIIERRKLAKRMIVEINNRLLNGWNPFLENTKTKEFTKLFDVFNLYIKHLTIEYKDKKLRLDTFRSYSSRMKILKEYIISRKQEGLLCYKFNDLFISDFQLNNVSVSPILIKLFFSRTLKEAVFVLSVEATIAFISD